MKSRRSMSRRSSRKSFTRGAVRTHPFNGGPGPKFVMRGGIRM